MRSETKRRGLPAGSLTGVFLILGGAIILLDHLGLMEARQIFRFWPMLLILGGILRMQSSNRRSVGILMIAFGVLVQLSNLGIAHLTWHILWPVGLICAGFLMVWDRFFASRTPVPEGIGPGYLNEFALFGGVERKVTTSDFRGGTVSAIFGGVELDLRSSDMVGSEAIIEVEVTCAGVEMIVPTTWTVACHSQSIFGGYSDETITPPLDPLRNAPAKVLIIRGRCLFGGVSIKN